MFDCRLIADTKDELGEGPVFVPGENALRWVDIFGKRWHRHDLGTGALRTIDLAEGLTSFAPRRSGGFVGTFESGFAFLSEDAAEIAWLHRPETTLPDNRLLTASTAAPLVEPNGRGDHSEPN